MKRLFSIIIMLVVSSAIMMADESDRYAIVPQHVSMEKEGSLMAVNMNLDLQSLDVSSNKAIVITPVVRNGKDYQELKSVGVYGKRRYIQYQRIYGGMVTGEQELSFISSKAPADFSYQEVIPFTEWMKGAKLELQVSEYGCCRSVLDERTSAPIASYQPAIDTVVKPAVVIPKVEASKHRMLAGRAYIDFPVSEMVIYPEYRRNPTELAKIMATIDSLNEAGDVRVASITFKGYASPESSWANNTRLAKGRTQALKDYVMKLYHFDSSFIHTSYEPEDWEGLRKFVETSNLSNKEGLLAIINSSLEPDAREWKLKTTYPKEYRFLLDYVYPGLRHCDYVIEYDVLQ